MIGPLTAAIAVGTPLPMWRPLGNSAWFILAGGLIGIGHTLVWWHLDHAPG